jgi:GNAT superfamily N-acetyltransferase
MQHGEQTARADVPDSGVTIRIAARADYDVLVAALGQPEYFADRLGRARHNLGELLVAWAGDTPIGDVYLWREPLEEPELRAAYPGVPLLNHLEVVPAWQGRGIGTALVRACEEAARDDGADILLLAVGVDNPDARRLYERLGYLDWQGGPIVARWTEPDGAGGIRAAELTVDPLVRSLRAPDLGAWDAWRPREIADRLSGVDFRWHVAGGWAIDLWRESLGLDQLREHGDLEIAVPRADFVAVAAAFEEFALFSAGSGAIVPIRDRTVAPEPRQVWVADLAVPAYRTDVFLEPGDAETWICRRGEGITRPMSDAVGRTADGVPFLVPECVLLYKARWSELAKNEIDFAASVPLLDLDARSWLADALANAHPGHPWIARL